MTRACLGVRRSSSSGNVSQARGHSLGSLPRASNLKVSPIYVDRSTAGDREVSEDTDGELQDLVRVEMQWASSFGSTSSQGPEEAL